MAKYYILFSKYIPICTTNQIIVSIVRKAKPRIFNGVRNHDRAHPWYCLVTYVYFNEPRARHRINWSSGVLISKKHVLTAAHVLIEGYQE